MGGSNLQFQPVQEIDYLLIGHVCQDITPDGARPGGTVTFGALTGKALGLRAGILTSAPDSMLPLLKSLRDVPVVCVPSEHPTTFHNHYTSAGRVQVLSGRANDLRWEHVPLAWRTTPVVHLAPVANEVDTFLARQFDGTFLGVTPQGWMRQWDHTGNVSFVSWNAADEVLGHAQAAVLSIEDLGGDETLIPYLAELAQILVITRGRNGSTLYTNGKTYNIPAPSVTEHDPTGAGDIFAASFFIRLKITGDPLASARFATALASTSITRTGLDSIPDDVMIEFALQAERD
jgi:hypothetical protein